MHSEFNIAPLSSSFMLTSIVGFLVSAFYVAPAYATWGFTLVLFFTMMFIAAVISMTYSPTEWPLQSKKGKK